ncbi:vicilin-like seed storage protein At2g28490 isoform X2 [Vigna unguiculata]|uniref:vicilin-like seed storage protein At2g28490 isoform X2 n=1 Tax=Vigna unguiculata TaxID=3917 RepID=UPI001016310A|nr:vicilin-like seed storage protein At2g28490 isoform X2 [Vigna unguiculata]
MGSSATLLVLLFVLGNGVAVTMGRFLRTEVEVIEEDLDEELFLMKKSKLVANTSVGKIRVFYDSRVPERRLQTAITTMEPRSLLTPHLVAATQVMYVRSGEAKLGYIYKNNQRLTQMRLREGDVYQIPAGSAFYIANEESDQKLEIISGIEPSQGLRDDVFESFYIAGGANSGLSGFKEEILEASFNKGKFVRLKDSQATGTWSKFLELKEEEKLQQLREMVQQGQENEEVEKEDEESGDDEEEQQQTSLPWRMLFKSVFGEEIKNTREKITEDPPRSYNLNKRKPDFENKYGWRVAVDGSQYHPLKSSGIGIYHEYLSAGSMMAPRVNPMATEYGIVVNGSGRVQVLFPNGSNAMDTNITKGDVFFIPSNFPYCEIAHKGESLELLGFTTSAQRNRPVVLVGARSVVRTMEGPELATSFGVSKEEIKHLVSAQHESVILPTP